MKKQQGQCFCLKTLLLGTVFICLSFLVLPAWAEPVAAQAEPTLPEWTFMIYMDADNNLNGAAWNDLDELEMAGNNEQLNVVVLVDNYRRNNSAYFILEGHEMKEVLPLGEVNMGDPVTLHNFVTWAKENYPAKHYALDLWDHGGGFLNWGEDVEADKGDYQSQDICWDDTDGEAALNMGEIRTALAGQYFDLLTFDACLMNQVEIAYEFRELGNVFLAAQETVPGDGFPYKGILNLLNENPTLSAEDWAAGIVDVYMDYYGNLGVDDITLSALKLEQLPAIMTPLNELAQLLSDALADYYHEIEWADFEVQRFAERTYMDLYDFTLQLDEYLTDAEVPGIEAANQTLRNAIDKAVMVNDYLGHSVENSHGISLWNLYPTYDKDKYLFGKRQYDRLAFAPDSQWDEYLDAFMQQENVIVSVPDAALAQTIREALNLETDAAITRSNLFDIELFQCNGKDIADLQGLEEAISLNELNLCNNQIQDLTSLANLPLYTLWLSDNQIKDVSPLIDLEYLSYLYLRNNHITDLSVLKDMKTPYLQIVDLRGNPLDLSPGSPTVETIESWEAYGIEVRYDGTLPPTGNFTKWDTEPQVAGNHEFRIQFNAPVDAASINNETVFVVDNTSKPISQNIYLDSDHADTVIVASPEGGYVTGQYTLYIKEIMSEKGKALTKGIYMMFEVN